MDIHEYQAKEILSSFGVTVPRGGIVYSPETAENKAREIGGSKWVVKAQIHSGARGKAGGVIVCNTPLDCLLYTSPSPRDGLLSRMPSSA